MMYPKISEVVRPCVREIRDMVCEEALAAGRLPLPEDFIKAGLIEGFLQAVNQVITSLEPFEAYKVEALSDNGRHKV